MLFGAHISSAGGVFNAPERAKTIGCTTFQMFSRPPQGGKLTPLTEEVVLAFKQAMDKNKIKKFYIHAPYFINLASNVPKIYKSSIAILREELERGSILGCRAIMFHPGSSKDESREEAKKRVILALDEILEDYSGSCQLLIENSAGAGNIMGDTFEELSEFIKGSKYSDKIGICLDTQHAFASGYQLKNKDDVENLLTNFDNNIGLDKLVVIHANDSKVACGEHKDRHEHLGHGYIGKEVFCAIVGNKKIKDVDIILETPADDIRLEDIALLNNC